ncbi:MAG TPA: endonuclease/exonuclease/phosphatase family protein [Acidimicrobiales bacterium]
MTAPVRVVTLNLLHGAYCPPETDSCRAPERVELFAGLLEEAGCPDLVGLQEIGARLEELLPPALARVCDGDYRIAWQGVESGDREMVLTRLPVLEEGHLDIASVPWEAYWVRVDSPQGPVDFLTAHFASFVNDPPCAPDVCPAICAEGISTNQCHAVEVVDFYDRRPDGARLSITTGDLNAVPGSHTLATLTEAGFVDAWLLSGEPECDPETHLGCTGGGSRPGPFVGMDRPEGPGFDERIDYVLVRPDPGCTLRAEAEGFAATPQAQPLNGLWRPSDHAGVTAALHCARDRGALPSKGRLRRRLHPTPQAGQAAADRPPRRHVIAHTPPTGRHRQRIEARSNRGRGPVEARPPR